MGCIASRPTGSLSEKQALLAAYAARATQVDTTAQLAALREQMACARVDAYIVPTEDAHGSETPAPCDRRVAFVSGFSGSTAMAVILADSAHLFTDGRYHVQASEQLDAHWTLHRVGESGVADWPAWLAALPHGIVVGADATLLAHSHACALEASLSASGKTLTFPPNLVDAVWDSRPPPVLAPVYEHQQVYAGVPASKKLADLREWTGSGLYVLSALDEIAWLLNLRGASVPCTRTYGDKADAAVFPAYLTVSRARADLFINKELLDRDVRRYLASLGVAVHVYDAVWDALRTADEPTVFVHERASRAVVAAAGAARCIQLSAASPVALSKARKNATELRGMRAAYLRDGAAWARWAAWLEAEMRRGARVSEADAAAAFERVRAEDTLYVMPSYDAISAAGPNAALPHYETPAVGSRELDRVAPYLNDSGAQYHDGTIDTTRTVHFGRPTAEQRRAYTRVLQGHMALARARFPAGTTGAQLDMLARQPLYQDGYNYMHGTGHGIGSFLGVHEGPHGLSSLSGGARVPVPLEEGMVLSNEVRVEYMFNNSLGSTRLDRSASGSSLPSSCGGALRSASLAGRGWNSKPSRASQSTRAWLTTHCSQPTSKTGSVHTMRACVPTSCHCCAATAAPPRGFVDSSCAPYVAT